MGPGPESGATAHRPLRATDAGRVSYTPRPYRRTAVPSPAALHGLQRFTAGYTPALTAQVSAAGGFARWFDRQLADGYDDAWATQTAAWWSSITATYEVTTQRDRDGVEGFWRADANYQAWSMVRRFGSQRQVRETMADFWEHHFHVPTVGEVGPFRSDYGRTIRGLALGRFDELLRTAVLHPAMQHYLGNVNSSKSAPNENLARELMELHTVGRGPYTEDDVKAVARLLTGWRSGNWVMTYDPTKHWTGAVTAMDFTHPNTDPDGRVAVLALLDHLARHPSTAQRVATKLAQRFVSDTPPSALVQRLAQVYLDADTAIAPVLRALIASPEFAASVGAKVRTPAEDVVATMRSLGVRLSAPGGAGDAAANAIVGRSIDIGLAPFAWPRPDGRPDEAAAWSSASRFLASLETHYSLSGGWWPKKGIVYRTPRSWLPASRIRFDLLVDHLSRTLLGRPSTAKLLRVACEASGCKPAELITAQHRIVKWDMPRLLTAFLDSPTHLTR